MNKEQAIKTAYRYKEQAIEVTHPDGNKYYYSMSAGYRASYFVSGRDKLIADFSN